MGCEGKNDSETEHLGKERSYTKSFFRRINKTPNRNLKGKKPHTRSQSSHQLMASLVTKTGISLANSSANGKGKVILLGDELTGDAQNLPLVSQCPWNEFPGPYCVL